MPDTTPDSQPTPILKMVARYKTRPDVHEVFGLILYNEQHPFVIKVLRDPDFWNPLDSKSGSRWPVFSVRPVTSPQAAKPEFLQNIGPDGGWDEPWENDELIEQFEIAGTMGLPMFLILAQGPGREVLRAGVSLEANSVEECYQILSETIEAATDAIKDVTPEYVKNTCAIFDLIEWRLQQKLIFQHIKRGLSFAEWAKSMFSLFGLGK